MILDWINYVAELQKGFLNINFGFLVVKYLV